MIEYKSNYDHEARRNRQFDLRQVLEKPDTQKNARTGEAFLFPQTSLWDDITQNPKALLVGFMTGACIAVLLSVLSLKAFEKKQLAPIVPQIIEKEDGRIPLLEGELELIKEILSGLVNSVQTLSKVQPNDELRTLEPKQHKFPYAIRVTSKKAYLRKGPDRSEESLAVIEQGTVLLVTEKKKEWLRVSTPKGETAWISEDIVEEEGQE